MLVLIINLFPAFISGRLQYFIKACRHRNNRFIRSDLRIIIRNFFR